MSKVPNPDPNVPPLTQAAQDYLKAVYHLGRSGNAVNTNELAEALEVAPASVTGMLKRLSKDGYVDYTPRQGAELTSKGLRVALEVIRHHRLLEKFFVDRMGMDWVQAHREAETLEHYISEEFENALDAEMGFPDSDPQGSPIPSRTGEIRADSWLSLVEVKASAEYVVRQVRHPDRELLRYIEKLGLVPGTRLSLLEIGQFEGPVTIVVQGATVHLGHKAAGAIRVESASGSKTADRDSKDS
jgi:DtxR family Mn-dependent transcriptional regulator